MCPKPFLGLTWLHPGLCHLLKRGQISELLPPTSLPGSQPRVQAPSLGRREWMGGQESLKLAQKPNRCVSAESLHTPDSRLLHTTHRV